MPLSVETTQASPTKAPMRPICLPLGDHYGIEAFIKVKLSYRFLALCFARTSVPDEQVIYPCAITPELLGCKAKTPRA